MGANIDAIKTAKMYGINKDRAVNYHADSQGTKLSYSAVNMNIQAMRAERKINDDWKDELEDDFHKRK